MMNKKRKQRGVALLLSLGIIFLLLVMALAFAANAVLARKSAANNSSRIQAVFLAQSAANRIMARMRAAQDSSDIISSGTPAITEASKFDEIMSANQDESRLSKDDTLVSDDKGFSLLNYDDGILQAFNPDKRLKGTAKPKWEYVRGHVFKDDGTLDTSVSAANLPIIGRIAYCAIPGGRQINLSEALRGNPAIAGDTGTKLGRSWEKRFGADMKEFNLAATGKIPASLNSMSNRFNTEDYSDPDKPTYKDGDGNTKDDGVEHNDYKSLDDVSATDDEMVWIKGNFLASGYNDLEVYIKDDIEPSDKLSDKAKSFHRFNLNRLQSEWNKGSSVEDDDVRNTKKAVNRLLGDDVPYEKTDTVKNIDPLPFLRMIGNDGGAFPDIKTRRQQIAANLLDYCDGDSIPTSDSYDWSSAAPNFTGNEKTPYINEVAVTFAPNIVFNRNITGTGTDGTTVTKGYIKYEFYEWKLDKVFGELINIYDSSVSGGSAKLHVPDIVVEGKISINNDVLSEQDFRLVYKADDLSEKISAVDGDSGTRYTVASGSPVEITSSSPENEKPQSGIKEYDNSSGVSIPTKLKVTVKITSVIIKSMRLEYSNGAEVPEANVDYVQELKVTGLNLQFDEEINLVDGDGNNIKDVTSAKAVALGFEVEDPRVNLYQTGAGGVVNWTFGSKVLDAAPAGADALKGGGLTFGAHNTKATGTECTASAGNDNEDITKLSTNYIRNGRMKSPMELGAIHRGAKWETINLKAAGKYAKVSDYVVNFDLDAAGTSYDKGDGGILNQIKMTDKVASAGKVNLNDVSDEILKALFDKIRIDDKYSVEDNTGDVVDATAAGFTSWVTTLKDKLEANKIFARAEILALADAGWDWTKLSTKGSDAAKEALIGKMINLTSSIDQPSDTVQFIIVAQSIKDVGGGISMSKFDPLNESMTTPVERTVATGTFDLESGVYFDEITGEVKMLATFKYSNSPNKVTLVSLELID